MCARAASPRTSGPASTSPRTSRRASTASPGANTPASASPRVASCHPSAAASCGQSRDEYARVDKPQDCFAQTSGHESAVSQSRDEDTGSHDPLDLFAQSGGHKRVSSRPQDKCSASNAGPADKSFVSGAGGLIRERG
eukprot:14904181-Alexandrium_andersonii.AAC.1